MYTNASEDKVPMSLSRDTLSNCKLFRNLEAFSVVLRSPGSTSGVVSKVVAMDNNEVMAVHRRIGVDAGNRQTSLFNMPIGRNLLALAPLATGTLRPSRYWSSVPSPRPTSVNFIHFVGSETSDIF